MVDPSRALRSRRSRSQRIALCASSGALCLVLSVARAEPPAPRDDAPLEAGEQPLEVVAALRQGSEPITADEVAALSVQTGPSIARARAVARNAEEAASLALVAVYPRLAFEAR